MSKSSLNQESMNTVNLGRQKFFQPLEHLSFLQKVSQEYVSGKLQVFSISQQWSIYFEEGKLIYACQLNDMWNLFYKTLQQLSPSLELNNQVYHQLKVIFDSNNDDGSCSSYLAICWLLDQQYINTPQVTQFIQELAVEVMDSFLKLRDGIYEFLSHSFLDDLPKFTHIDISTIARLCQQRAHKIGNFVHPVYRTSNHLFPDLKEQELASFNKPPLSETKLNHRTDVNKAPIKPVNNYIDTPVESVKNINVATQVKFTPADTQLYTNTNVQVEAPVNQDINSNGVNKPYKVMCIDDSPTIIKAMQGFLDKDLFQVMGVTDSLKALMQILRAKPDIILLDISMPNLDGYELCSLLRKHPEFRYTPVVMVTGRTGFVDKARAKLVKASGYLTKPFTQAELVKTVFQQISYLT
jgi:twitching motility two-component system response regulator PilG